MAPESEQNRELEEITTRTEFVDDSKASDSNAEDCKEVVSREIASHDSNEPNWEIGLGCANERLERAIAATREGIWDWPSVNSDNMWWSPMCFRLLGYEPREIEPKLSVWMSLVHPEDQVLVKGSTIPHQDRCFVDLHREFEYRMRHKSGDYRWYEHRTLVEHDESGRPHRMAGSVSDIHLRKNLERSLREQVQQRDNFLAILSHELRNPINAIKNANQLRLLLQQAHGDKTISRTDDVIRMQIDHLARLLDDLLDASRLSHNKLELRLTRFDLRETVEHVSDSIKASLYERGIKLILRMPAEKISVLADYDRIIQCQMNLLNNALKFSNRGGIIEHSLVAIRDFAEIKVCDTGVGMTGEVIKSVFELFNQGRNEPHKTESGMGVGLALVRGIVELHNGTIEAKSSGVGCGSQFTMRIPIDRHTDIAAPGIDRDDIVSRSGNDFDSSQQAMTFEDADRSTIPSIFIVDDLDAGRETLAQILELSGFRVTQADSGRSAITMLTESNSVEAILIDIGLPDISGLEVAKLLRQTKIIRHDTKLIAITGYGQQKDIQASSDAGFDAHLTKPVDLQRLLRILRS